jgi:hypothetical protein
VPAGSEDRRDAGGRARAVLADAFQKNRVRPHSVSRRCGAAVARPEDRLLEVFGRKPRVARRRRNGAARTRHRMRLRVVSLRRVAGHAPFRAHELGLVLERDPGSRPDGFDHEPFAGLRGEPGGRRAFTARRRRGRRAPPAAVQCSGEGDQSSTACACHDLASIPCAISPPARHRAP